MTSSSQAAESRSSSSKAAGTATTAPTTATSGQDISSSSTSKLRARKKTSAAGSRQEREKREGKTRGVAGDKKSDIAQLDGRADDNGDNTGVMPTLPPVQAPNPRWVLLALLSGAFAAMNGVFAKLTTSSDEPPFTSFFTSLLSSISPLAIQAALRAAFFGLNLASNAVMWVLFTRALTSHPSTTKVSVVNTSANFALTAVMGALVFRESLGGLGGVAGLALLVGGCVILGAKKEKDDEETSGTGAVGIDAPIVDAEIGGAVLDEYRDDVEVESEVDLIDLEEAMKSEYDPGAILDGTETESEVEI